MLVPCNYLDELLRQKTGNTRRSLTYFASDIFQELNLKDEEVSAAIRRTFQTFEALGISQEQNFCRVYRFDGESLFPDWKVSSLAACLLVINCSPANEAVARAQIFFIMRRF